MGLLNNWNRNSEPNSRAVIVMKRFLLTFLISSFIILLFITSHFTFSSRAYVFSNTIVILLSSTIVGALIGFLFGIPRSVQFGFDKTKSKTNETTNRFFDDNTNLEEISDWLTKIIVGLTLIQARKILFYFDKIAITVSNSYPKTTVDLYTFSYCIIIFYLGLGFFGGYIWTRTLFGSILAQSKINERDLVNILNKNLLDQNEQNQEYFEKNLPDFNLEDFKLKTYKLLKSTPIIKTDDTQNGRWGGKSKVGDKVLNATVNKLANKLFEVNIQVTSSTGTLNDMVVVLLDSTFVEDVVYVNPKNNKASLKVYAYEAFTIGALCDDLKVTLELDLQQMNGLPSDFYWK